MPREVNDHKIENVSELLDITVLDEPGHGNACHEYVISHVSEPDEFGNVKGSQLCRISFQNGPIKEFGVNGITQEALLAICIDRLRSFQLGSFSCPENEQALMNLVSALGWLQHRTRERANRGVEGQNII